jgi:hypothetical protein
MLALQYLYIVSYASLYLRQYLSSLNFTFVYVQMANIFYQYLAIIISFVAILKLNNHIIYIIIQLPISYFFTLFYYFSFCSYLFKLSLHHHHLIIIIYFDLLILLISSLCCHFVLFVKVIILLIFYLLIFMSGTYYGLCNRMQTSNSLLPKHHLDFIMLLIIFLFMSHQ